MGCNRQEESTGEELSTEDLTEEAERGHEPTNIFVLFSGLPSSTPAAATRSAQEASTSEKMAATSSNEINTERFLSRDELIDWSNADALGVQVQPGYRYPIQYLVKRWKAGETEPLDRLLRAWIKIQELPPEDRRSFTYIAGLHGQPFIKRPEVEDLSRENRYEYWGGYCPHDTILFPVWHRAYLDYLEKALQQFEPDAMLAYWDELDPDTLNKGLPEIFTQETVELNGEKVANPLKSFTFPVGELMWRLPEHSKDEFEQKKIDRMRERYDFTKAYTTVRYPLFRDNIGTQEKKRAAVEANRRYDTEKGGTDPIEYLNQNISGWLKNPNADHPESASTYFTAEKYRMALDVEDYTLMSCATAMTFHKMTTGEPGFSLEEPHNDMHDAAGGASYPLKEPAQQAYGDMGTLETSAFDPLFWFHHCFVDRMFWYWQRMHDATEEIQVTDGYPGTRSADGFGGPTVGQGPHEVLNMKTPLLPFVNCECDGYFTGADMVNIQDLGYMYRGSTYTTLKFVEKKSVMKKSIKDDGTRKAIIVRNVDRTRFSGTFVVIAYLKIRDERTAAGYQTVFNRLIPESCTGCMHHKMRNFSFPLNRVDKNIVYDPACMIEVEFHGDVDGDEEVTYTASWFPGASD